MPLGQENGWQPTVYTFNTSNIYQSRSPYPAQRAAGFHRDPGS
jgi:hypothetical protein